MTDQPLVSIVIDNFNYARFLSTSIDSALAQTHPRIEVIVVDDCSTDNSRAVVAGYGDQVVPVLKTVNEGHGAAFNTGFAASNGGIVLFLDSDDYLYPDAAAAIVRAMRPGTAQVQFRLDLVDVDGRHLDLYPAAEVGFDSGDVTPRLLATGRYSTTVTSGLAFARDALKSVLPMPAEEFRQGGDGYLAAVVPFYGRVASIEQALGGYRRHGANHSGFASQVAKRARWRLFHDAARYRAIGRHAAFCGMVFAGADGARDIYHLEERLASWTIDPALHEGREVRPLLAWKAARAALAQPSGLWRRSTLAATYVAVGLSPAPVARRLISWKMEASTRPAVTRFLARVLRRRLAAGARMVSQDRRS